MMGSSKDKKYTKTPSSTTVISATSSNSVGGGSTGSGSGSKCTPTRVKNCIRIFLAHLFSHVGLCILIVSYACAGAFLFEHLEADKEQELRAQTNQTWTMNIPQIRKDCVGELWNITIKFNVLYELNWTAAVEKELKKFEEEVAKTAATDGYLIHNETETKKKWSFSGALLYAVSIITTIGYGDRCPKTEKGKILTMFYAIIGVPLMLLWLSNIGSLMANTFKFIYSHARCSSNSNSNSKPSKAVQNNKCPTTTSSSSFPTSASTQVKYSMAEKTCETSLVYTSSSPSHNQNQNQNQNQNRYPPPPHRRESLKNLDPAAKMVLLECAEYNVNVCEDPRSRRVLRQLYNPNTNTNEHECDHDCGVGENYPGERGDESSDADSVIDMTCQQGGGHVIVSDSEPCSVQGSVLGVGVGSGGLRRNKQFAQVQYGTPSKVPLLLHHGESGPDLVDMEIGMCGADNCVVEEDPMMMMMIPMDSHIHSHSHSHPHTHTHSLPHSHRHSYKSNHVHSNHVNSNVNSNSNSAGGYGFSTSKERVPISLVLAFVVAYLMVGAACFNTWEGWGLLDSAYFCFISLTTIGLGDLTPGKSLETEKTQGTGHGQLIFCCLYLVLGLAILAMTFNLVQEEVVAKVKDCARHMGIIKDDMEV